MSTIFRYPRIVLGIIFILSIPTRGFGEISIATTSAFLQTEPYASKKISMDFKGANLNDVLKIFSQQSGLNFIASEDVAGKTLNLYLDNVPVEEALERILSANGLRYEMNPGSNVFVVKKFERPEKELMTRVYLLKYATVSSSQLQTTLANAAGGSETSSSSSSSSSGSAASSTSGTSGGGIVSAIKAVLTSNGSIVEDSRTNSLVVTDMPAQFPLIEQTIARLDVRVPQILIEVEMLDISKRTSDLMGAKFGNTLYKFQGASKPSLYPFNLDNAIDDGHVASGDFKYTQGITDFSGLTLLVQFLRTQTDTKSLARPRILTLNNEMAIITISTNEAIGLASTTTSTGTSSENIGAAERVETGVFLTVTPQANVDTGEITLAVVPSVIEAKTGGTFGTGTQAQTFKDPETRGSKSVLRVRDGDTIILGGLLRNDLSKTVTKIPFLSSVPIVGAAFRHKDSTDTQRELIIFITPHIVKEDDLNVGVPTDHRNIVREQSASQSRFQTIENQLSTIEKQRD